jgi:hypothetical protein
MNVWFMHYIIARQRNAVNWTTFAVSIIYGRMVTRPGTERRKTLTWYTRKMYPISIPVGLPDILTQNLDRILPQNRPLPPSPRPLRTRHSWSCFHLIRHHITSGLNVIKKSKLHAKSEVFMTTTCQQISSDYQPLLCGVKLKRFGGLFPFMGLSLSPKRRISTFYTRGWPLAQHLTINLSTSLINRRKNISWSKQQTHRPTSY